MAYIYQINWFLVVLLCTSCNNFPTIFIAKTIRQTFKNMGTFCNHWLTVKKKKIT